MATDSTGVMDFLRDVIALAEDRDSPKADRAAMFASDLLAKAGAAKKSMCLAEAMGYDGPTGEVIVSGVAQDVLTRSHSALREYGADVDMANVTAGLAAAARIIRTSARADHDGCLVFMMRAQLGRDGGLAPKSISHRVPGAAQIIEGDDGA
jgi:hypothetical protein